MFLSTTHSNKSSDASLILKMLEFLPGMHLLLSPGLVIQWVSNDYLKETMLSREAILGKYLFDIFPESHERVESSAYHSLPGSLQHVLQTKQIHQINNHGYKLPDLHRPGTYLDRYWQITNTPVLDEQGEVICIIHQTENVTQKVLVERQLEESRLREHEAVEHLNQSLEQLYALFEQAPVAITILLGEEYVVQQANPAVLEIWARRKYEVLNKPLFDAMPEIRQQGLEELLERVRTTGQPYIGKELPVELNRYGKMETVYFNFVYQPLRAATGAITGIAVVATDVTELVKSRKAIEITASQLQELNVELESRVASRTSQLQEAKVEAEASHSRLYNLFMQAPGVIAILQGPMHHFVLANPGCQELFGSQTIMGKTIREVLSEAENDELVALLDQVFHTGDSYSGKEMSLLIPGQYGEPSRQAYFNFIYQPYRNAEGQVEGIIAFAYEVTDMITARRSLAEQAERFQLLLESIPQMAWTATPAGEVDYYNARWYTYTGQSPAEAMGNGWIGITHPDDVAAILPSWQHALQTSTLYEVECRYRRAADGAWRWHLVRALPMLTESGTMSHWVGTCTDIHAEKLHTEQLVEREAYFREMSDTVPVMIWVTRSDGACTYLNKGWYTYTGQEEEESLGLGWLKAIHPKDLKHSQDVFLQATAQKQPFAMLYRLKSREVLTGGFSTKGNLNTMRKEILRDL